MEFFILMISVPLFLLGVLLLAVFVLAKYAYRQPAGSGSHTHKSAPQGVAMEEET